MRLFTGVPFFRISDLRNWCGRYPWGPAILEKNVEGVCMTTWIRVMKERGIRVMGPV